MAFVGQFGPTFMRNTGVRRLRDSGLYLLGVMIASTTSVGVAYLLVGTRVQHFSPVTRISVVVIVLSVLLLLDSFRLWGGRTVSLGLNRQTPYRWRLRGAIGVVGWGLDTGVPFTTVRATPLPFLGLVLVSAGFGSVLHGAAYGLGIAAGLLSTVVRGKNDGSFDPAYTGLRHRRDKIGVTRLVLMPYSFVGATVLAVYVFGSVR